MNHPDIVTSIGTIRVLIIVSVLLGIWIGVVATSIFHSNKENK